MVSISVRSWPRPCAKRDQVVDLVVVGPLQGHGVDLDLKARRLGRLETGHDGRKIAPAGDGAEAVGLQRIEREVDAGDAGVLEVLGKALELAAVGGERQLIEHAAPQVACEPLDEPHDVLAYQRLAAGDAQLPHAAGNEGGAQPV